VGTGAGCGVREARLPYLVPFFVFGNPGRKEPDTGARHLKSPSLTGESLHAWYQVGVFAWLPLEEGYLPGWSRGNLFRMSRYSRAPQWRS